MRTDLGSVMTCDVSARVLQRLLLAAGVLLSMVSGGSFAQTAAPLVQGTGPGVHSPNSPIAPLAARSDVVPWSVLSAVTTRIEKKRVLPQFQRDQLALSDKVQRIQGFMLPLEPGERQRRFLLSAVPLTCGFCLPGGPESMVEVRTLAPVAYTQEPVTVQGRFSVLADDPQGLYYRLTEGVTVK